jgi:hypothetical protein
MILGKFRGSPIDLTSEYRKIQEKTIPVIVQELGLIDGIKNAAKGIIAVMSIRTSPRRIRGITVASAKESNEPKRNALKIRMVRIEES